MFGNRYFGSRYYGDRYFGPGSDVAPEAPTVTTAGRSFGTQYREKTISRELRDKERAARRAQRIAEHEAREAAFALPPEITALLVATPWATEPPKPLDSAVSETLLAFARVAEVEDEDFLLLASN